MSKRAKVFDRRMNSGLTYPTAGDLVSNARSDRVGYLEQQIRELREELKAAKKSADTAWAEAMKHHSEVLELKQTLNDLGMTNLRLRRCVEKSEQEKGALHAEVERLKTELRQIELLEFGEF